MARVVGLDIGQTSVRAVVLELNLRAYSLVEALEEQIVADEDGAAVEAQHAADDADGRAPGASEPTGGPEDASAEEVTSARGGLSAGQRDALAKLAARGIFEADAVYTALPVSDALLTRVALPFGTPREIQAVIGPQLEGRLPAEVDELVIDFMRGGKLPSGEFAIYAAAMEPDRLRSYLSDLNALGLDPRALDIRPFPLLSAARALVDPAPEGSVAIVEIGFDSTGVVVFGPDGLQYARTFAGGGERITEAVSAMFDIDADRAREGKHREGFINLEVPAREQASGDDEVDVAASCRHGAEVWLRQLRRTLHAHATEWGTGVQAVYLCGGGSQLRGLCELTSESLGVPVEPVPANAAWLSNLPGFADASARFTTALGLALRGAPAVQGSTLNARRGEFAFRGSHENLRRRAPQLVVGLALLCILAVTMAFGRVALLRAESRSLDGALEALSEAVFGEAVTSPDEALRRLRLGAARPSFIPTRSAYALFAEVSQTVGGTLDLGYEIAATSVEVDLERRIFRVEGTADSAESVDTFQSELAAHTCFRSIERDDLSQRRGADTFSFSVQGVIDCGGTTQEQQ